ncbi:RnfABCDGE type electron transport complex subunit G [Bacteroidales bacterium OttesenSCG-928-C19]|nr:RnfABCDGE type electron transport complex subunit G [Bacteroidales bacterium OttesenSCG-928-C19]
MATKKKESSFINMVVTLLVVTVVSATSLAYVNSVTEKPRKDSQAKKQQDALKIVLPEFTRLDEPVIIPVESDGENVTLFNAYNNDELVGTAVETYSMKGFSGKISILVGFLPDGSIFNTAVLSHAETPGLGDKMDASKSDFSEQFKGINPNSFTLKVKKDGGDIDAITAATISSRAFSDALQRAYDVLQGVSVEKPAKTIADILPEHKTITTKTIVDANEQEMTINETFGENGELVAIGVETYSRKAFHDKMTVMVSFLPNGDIYDSYVINHTETPGYGDMIEAENSDFTNQFKGKNPESFKLKSTKDGGDVDIYSGATITTNAYAEAIQKAYDLVKKEGLIK